MYVPPDALTTVAERHLKPLDKSSIEVADVSASDVFGNNVFVTTLYVSLLVSQMYQSEVLSVRFTITNAGLNPVNTKGPSVEPLPV